MKKSTDELNHELTVSEDFDRFMKENREAFNYSSVAEIFDKLLEKSGLSKAELAKNSGMSDIYLYQILSGKRTPSRNRVITLCIGLSQSPEETNEILKHCGYAELYVKNRRDAAIFFALQNHWDIFTLNEKLFEIGEETLF